MEKNSKNSEPTPFGIGYLEPMPTIDVAAAFGGAGGGATCNFNTTSITCCGGKTQLDDQDCCDGTCGKGGVE